MNKYLYPLLLGLMFLSSCSGNTMKTMTSGQGFSVEYPSDWKSGTETRAGVSFTDKTSGGIIVVSKNTMTDPTKKANSDFLKWYQSQKTLDTSGEISFGGKNGMYVIYSNTYGTLSFTHKDAWGIDGDTIYSLACTIPQKSKESLMKICDTMITSFKMVP